MNKMKVIGKLSWIEVLRLVRSTKIVILALFTIFINIQIITPLRNLSILMEDELSLFEPFIAVGNSGIVVLILPLFFVTMMADFPREGNSQYFYQIRCSKRIWVASQILYAIESAVLLTAFVLVVSVLLSLDFVNWNMDFSYAVTRFVSVFPQRAGEYVVQLIPENLYNQVPLPVTLLYTAMLLVLYFIMLAMIILLCSLVKKKIIGIFADALLILSGTITCAVRAAYMWAFPMAHTIVWLHYTAYERKPVLPLLYSYLYMGLIDIVLIVLAVLLSKRYDAMGTMQ